jgi:hypothetical protein
MGSLPIWHPAPYWSRTGFIDADVDDVGSIPAMRSDDYA